MTDAENVSWRPSAGIVEARRRALRLRQARDFFEQRKILEVDTPCIGEAAVSDVNIENVSTTLALSPGQDFYLQTSPEFYMKRLLAAGFPDIYQICKVFRDAEIGRRHQPEFTMVEWYRLGFGLDEMIGETVDFIKALIDPSHIVAEADQLSYCEAFTQFADIDPLTAGIDELFLYLDADQDLKAAIGDCIDDALDLILATRVSQHFASDRLTVVHHYPASQAALARTNPDDDRVADRFEVFVGSLELANGYVELTDAAEQRRRCETDQQKRRNRGAVVRPIDEKFLASLDSGLPACAGVAVGFDRLLMVDLEASHLGSTRHFPVEMT